MTDTAPTEQGKGWLGTVLAVQANYYQVRLADQTADESLPTRDLLCTRRSRLKKTGQRVMVGDRVLVEEPDWAGGRGAIAEVLPRQTELNRPPVANADQILLVFALSAPPVEPLQLSRFLVKAESTGMRVQMCFNKRDLVSAEEQCQWHARLTDWGYEPIMISVAQGAGLQDILRQLEGQTTIISGPSGVGKSSLINLLIPELELRVGDVSGKLQRGRHTTRHVELFHLPGGGLLADTPGFNQPELDCTPEALTQCFPEIRDRLHRDRCQFSDCLHRDEPNCAVRGDWERYPYYLQLLDEAIARQDALNRTSEGEATFKVKSREEGQIQYEPKLEPKKYRQSSRRSRQQALQEWAKGNADLLDEDEEIH